MKYLGGGGGYVQGGIVLCKIGGFMSGGCLSGGGNCPGGGMSGIPLVAQTGASWWRPYCPVVQTLWSFTAKAGRPSAAMATAKLGRSVLKLAQCCAAEGGLDQGSLCV